MESNKAVKETLGTFAAKMTALEPDFIAEMAEAAFELRIAADVLGELSPRPAFPEARAALSLAADILERTCSGRLCHPKTAMKAAADLLRAASERITVNADEPPAHDAPEHVDLLREMLRTAAVLEPQCSRAAQEGAAAKYTDTPM